MVRNNIFIHNAQRMTRIRVLFRSFRRYQNPLMKRIDRFAEIKLLLKKFNRAERKVLLVQSTALENMTRKGFENMAQALDQLFSQSNISRTDFLKSLKMEKLSSLEINAFLLHLKNFILESLVQDVNIFRPGRYSNRFRTQASNAKKLNQTEILISRNIFDQSEKLLEDVISRSLKYELFSQTQEAYRQLQFLYVVNRSARKFNRLSEQIDEVKQLRNAFEDTHELYLLFQLNKGHYPKSVPKEELNKTLEALSGILQKFEVQYTRYIHAILSIRLLTLTDDFRKARKAVEDLLVVLRNEPAIQSEKRESQLLFDLGIILMQLRKPEEARVAFTSAQSLLKRNSYESFLSNKYLTMIDFYQNNMESLAASLPRLLKSNFIIGLSYAVVQFEYFLAMYMFQTGNYMGAVALMRSHVEQRQGLQVDMRLGQNLLLFMAAVEIRYSEPEVAEEALKLSMENLNELYVNEEARKRDRLIIRLIRRITGSMFEFERTYALVKDRFQRLNLSDPEFRWEPFTYEIIPFDQWFNWKLTGRKSTVKLPPAPKPEE